MKSTAHIRPARTGSSLWPTLLGLAWMAFLGTAAASGEFRKLEGHVSWLYQLQNSEIDALAESGFSLAVIDYSRDGSDSQRFSNGDIARLLERKILPVGYLSIGEAENYRYYWNPEWVDAHKTARNSPAAPRWLGRANPDWQDNYKVRYWDEDWRDHHLKPYLDKILDSGFAGVYLDIVDAFEYWPQKKVYVDGGEAMQPGDPVGDEAEAARRMIELVKWIASYCRSQSVFGKSFLILPQNGERILLYDDDGSYLDAVSGIGVESIWYADNRWTSGAHAREKLNFLERFTAKGKMVLSVDYVDNGKPASRKNKDRIQRYLSQCSSQGFLCYAARSDAALDTINRISGIQPVGGGSLRDEIPSIFPFTTPVLKPAPSK